MTLTKKQKKKIRGAFIGWIIGNVQSMKSDEFWSDRDITDEEYEYMLYEVLPVVDQLLVTDTNWSEKR